MIPYHETFSSPAAVLHNMKEVFLSAHMHTNIEVLYCLKGKQNMIIDDVPYLLESGDAVVVMPNIIHQYPITKNDGYSLERALKTESLCIVLSSEIFYSYMPDFRNIYIENALIRAENIPPEVKTAFTYAMKEKDQAANIGYAIIIFAKLCSELTKEKDLSPSNGAAIYAILEYISDHLTENLTLDSISRGTNISKSHISHLFADKMQINLRRYIGMLRAEHAAMLIRTTSSPFSYIAFESGFESLRSFNRIFNLIYNVSPSEYRNNINMYINNVH